VSVCQPPKPLTISVTLVSQSGHGPPAGGIAQGVPAWLQFASVDPDENTGVYAYNTNTGKELLISDIGSFKGKYLIWSGAAGQGGHPCSGQLVQRGLAAGRGQ
jgi:hypothetical protein